MIDNIILQCTNCKHRTGLEPASNISFDDSGVTVNHSDIFSTKYNGASLKVDSIVHIILIEKCIFCK